MSNKFGKIGILGAGPAGQTLALALCTAGFSCVLMDARPDTQLRDTESDSRTTAISLATKFLFEHLGLWDDVAAGAVIIDTMHVATTTDAAIRFDPSTFSDQPMGYIVSNQDLRDALLRRIDHHVSSGKLELAQSHAASSVCTNDGRAVVTFDTQADRSFDLLIACDGRQSKARVLMTQPSFDRDYDQLGLVSNVRLERPHNNTAFQVFTDKGPIALLPLAPGENGENRASLIWSTQTDHGIALRELGSQAFAFILNANLPEAFPKVTGLDPVKSFPLRAHYLRQIVVPGIALAGEAAHGVHPLAGQGFNLTAKDVGTLVEAIQQNIKLGFPVGDLTGLRAYQERRSGDTAMMFTVTDVLAVAMSGDFKVPKLIQHLGFQAIDQFEPFKRRLTKHAMGLSDDLPGSMAPMT